MFLNLSEVRTYTNSSISTGAPWLTDTGARGGAAEPVSGAGGGAGAGPHRREPAHLLGDHLQRLRQEEPRDLRGRR